MKLVSTKSLLLLLLAISALTINPRINGWNEASRMALTQSIVEHGQLRIDNSSFIDTGDKIFVDGHFYSDKPPLPSLFASLIYWPLYQMGLELDYGWNLSYYLIVLLTVKLFWVLHILAFYHTLPFTTAKSGSQIPVTLVYAFASLAFSWSATFSNHSLAASSLMIAFYFYLKAQKDGPLISLFWSGLFFGLATSFDIPTGVFLLGFAFTSLKKWRMSSKLLSFAGASFIPMSFHFGLNYAVAGTLLPLQIIPEFFNYEGSAWINSSSLSGVESNSIPFILGYAIKSLVGPQGFLLHNPLLIIITPILWTHARKIELFRTESRVIILASIVLMAYYFIFSSNFSGWSYSIRWFVPLLPLGYFFLFDTEKYFQEGWQRYLSIMLIILSLIISGVGLINPWSNLSLHNIPFIANLKQLTSILF